MKTEPYFRTEDGWAQLDTAQDALYFGHWINPSRRAQVDHVCRWYHRRDKERPRIDTGGDEKLRAAFAALGLGDWLY